MKLKYRLLPIFILFFVFACEENLTPEQTADAFWAAVIKKDTEIIKKLISKESYEKEINKDEILSVSDYSLGKIVIDGPHSEIDTEVTLSGDDPLTVPITTYLIKENEFWKIDYKKTTAKINGKSELAGVLNNLSDMSKLFVEGLNESIDEMNKVLPKIEEELSNIEGELQSRIPELRDKLDEFVRKLEEALKNRTKTEDNETIEI